MIQKKELSTIAVAVELKGLDQVNEELDKMLIKLEKANSLADELALEIKDLCSKQSQICNVGRHCYLKKL